MGILVQSCCRITNVRVGTMLWATFNLIAATGLMMYFLWQRELLVEGIARLKETGAPKPFIYKYMFMFTLINIEIVMTIIHLLPSFGLILGSATRNRVWINLWLVYAVLLAVTLAIGYIKIGQFTSDGVLWSILKILIIAVIIVIWIYMFIVVVSYSVQIRDENINLRLVTKEIVPEKGEIYEVN